MPLGLVANSKFMMPALACALRLRAALLVLLAIVLPAAAETRPTSVSARPQFGLWYTVWWTADDQFRHWTNCHRFPTRGRYTAGDSKIIRAHFATFCDLGVDFLIMDDTNVAGNDGGRINDNIRAWFDFMDLQPATNRIPICIGGGGEMRGGGKAAQQSAANFYWDTWAQRASYFKLNGKPVVLVDTDKNYGPGDWDDVRFTVRWAYNGDNHAAMQQRQTWGWGSYAPAPELAECMSIWPGHRFPRYVAEQGQDPLEEPRQGGELYAHEWLRVLKARPQFVTVADWNNFEEETALEESYAWEDARGYCAPDLYVRLTRAASRLRSGNLVKGECYRAEDQPEVFQFDGSKLVYQAGMPKRTAVVLVPKELFAELKSKLAR